MIPGAGSTRDGKAELTVLGLSVSCQVYVDDATRSLVEVFHLSKTASICQRLKIDRYTEDLNNKWMELKCFKSITEYKTIQTTMLKSPTGTEIKIEH